MRPDEIVGYTYRADVYCAGCLSDALFGPLSESPGTEPLLDGLAVECGITRDDESSFDSDEFPKIIFAGQAEGTFCGACGMCLRCFSGSKDVDCFGNDRCPECDGPCPGCSDGEPVHTCELHSRPPAKAHAHLSTRSRDCDGTYDRTWVEVCESGDEHERYAWWVERMGWHLPATAEEPVTIGFRFMESMEFSHPTDEGFFSLSMTYCEDACDLDERSFRDHTAEAAGY